MRSHILVIVIMVFYSSAASAYVGPGPGLSMIGSFFTLVAGLGIALLMILIYPIRLFIKRRKQKKGGDNTPTA